MGFKKIIKTKIKIKQGNFRVKIKGEKKKMASCLKGPKRKGGKMTGNQVFLFQKKNKKKIK